MRALGRLLSIAIIAGALVLAVVVVRRVVRHPQTDDATVTADVINVVPEVAGRIVELHVVDNQAVKQGDLLFLIDPRAYEFAVEHDRADVQALDAEIDLTQRRIQGQEYATAAARAAVQRAEAQARNAADTYNRLVPLAQAGVRHRGTPRSGPGREAVDGGEPRRGPETDDAGRPRRRRPECTAGASP